MPRLGDWWLSLSLAATPMKKVVGEFMGSYRSTACGSLVLAIGLSACLSGGSGSDARGGTGGDADAMDSSVSSTGGRQAATGGRMSSTGGSDAPPTGSGGTPNNPPPFQPEWQACTAAEDCVFLRTESCCGCSLLGVNAQFEEQARESFPPFNGGSCGPVGCASPPCPIDPFPACTDGMCQALPGCSERPLDGCDTDGKCRIYNARNCQSPAEPFTPQRCALPPEVEPCSPEPTCRVGPAGLMVLFENACVPPVGYAQPCPIACD